MRKIIQTIIIFLILIIPSVSFAGIYITTFSPDNIEENSVTLSGLAYNIPGTTGGGGGGQMPYPIFGHFRYSKTSFETNACSSMTDTSSTKTPDFSNYQLTTEGIPLKANITGLEPNTNYYYCAVASNNPGTKLNITYGNVVKFRTATPPPENTNTGIISRSTDTKIDLIKNVQTYPAPEELLTDTEAIFWGSVGSIGPVAYGYFRYSKANIPPIFCNDIFGSNMKSVTATLPYKTGEVTTGNFYGGATGLAPNTDYYYCAVVSNSALNPTEIDYGGVKYFRTLSCATCDKEIITTKRASILNSKSVTLKGYYNFSRKVETYFEYRKKTEITDIVERDDGLPFVNDKWLKVGAEKQNANTNKNISFTLTNLIPDTMYEFRAVADAERKESSARTLRKDAKTFYGDIFSFKTPKYDGVGPVPKDCPRGWSGNFPDCVDPSQNTCAKGWTGVFPDCVQTDLTCAQRGMEGTAPDCKESTLTCAQLGLKGTQPNCTYPDEPPYPPDGEIPNNPRDNNKYVSVTVTATPSNIIPGETSTITWSSTNATSCNTGGNGGASSGSFNTGKLQGSKSFTIVCTGEQGTNADSAFVFVSIDGAGGNTSLFPTVKVKATPSNIIPNETSVIEWSSTNATSCNTGGHGTGKEGSFNTGALKDSKSFTVSCTGGNGTNADTAFVFVDIGGDGGINDNPYDPSKFPSVTVTASPSKIALNETSIIKWESKNATSCNTGGNGGASSGSFSTGKLQGSKSFTVSCTGAQGTSADSVFVFVGGDGNGNTDIFFPSVKVTAFPSSIVPGNSSTIKWESVNAVVCNSGGNGTGKNGSFSTGKLQGSKSFTVSCTGVQGTNADSAFVFVKTENERGGEGGNGNLGDQDGDGTVNPLDDDTDGDEIPNIIDFDDDNDGIPDIVDSTPTGVGTPFDYDGDGIPNETDFDIDGNGIPNILDNDTDGDGIPNNIDPDDDNDDNPDTSDSTPRGIGTVIDYDGDGIPNALDSSPYGNKNTNKVLTIGMLVEPDIDDIVRYHEGIEHVFARRIKKSEPLQKKYGYGGANLQEFAWELSHFLAKEFGYVDFKGKEIRVSQPDVSAYQLRIEGNRLFVYEYYKNRIIDIRSTNSTFKSKNPYEYYFKK